MKSHFNSIFRHSITAVLLFAFILVNPGLAQTTEKNVREDPSKILRVETQLDVTDILLDLVARDKGGKMVRDLKESEIEVYEDGAKQKINAFTLVEKSDWKQAAPTAPAAAAPALGQPDPIRQINLVTLVFENMDVQGRKLAQEGAMQFLKSELRSNVFVAVYVIDQRLMILQPFTNDKERLREAIDKATSRAYSQFAADSAAISSALQANAAANQSAGDSTTGSLGRGNTDTNNVGSSYIAARLAEAESTSLAFSDNMAREHQSRSSVYSLLSLARSQKTLAGRKTILYFSQGLAMTNNMKDTLKIVISEANRANVSVYAIDTRGLITTDQNSSSRNMLGSAAAQTRAQTQRSGGAVSYQDMMAGELGESSIYANFQETMAALSEQTGGKLIANSNDLGLSMNRVSEDIRTYYELAYSSENPKLDGKFREISVKVMRKGVTVQSRSGYFAVPRTDGSSPLTSFEMPLLGALASTPVPHDFEHRARIARFAQTTEAAQGSLILEIPLAQMTFKPAAENRFQAHFALLALLKTPDGRIIQKYSQEYDYQGEMAKLESTKKNNLLFMRHFLLPSGRYQLETVLRDADAGKFSVRKSVFVIPTLRPGVTMSSLSVVQRIAKAAGGTDPQEEDPFRLGDSQLFPSMGSPIGIMPKSSIYFYFVAYPDKNRSEKAQLILQFLQNGLAVSQAQIDLPAPDPQGRIPYLAAIPAESLTPGEYEVRAIVAQGNSAVEEHAFLTLTK
jgi:VWFA-related protein